MIQNKCYPTKFEDMGQKVFFLIEKRNTRTFTVVNRTRAVGFIDKRAAQIPTLNFQCYQLLGHTWKEKGSEYTLTITSISLRIVQ